MRLLNNMLIVNIAATGLRLQWGVYKQDRHGVIIMSFGNKSTVALATEKDLRAWTERHALAVGLGLLGFLLGLPRETITVAVAISFSALMLRFRKRWTPLGQFGVANLITLFRLGGVFLLFSLADLESGWVAAIALFLFALDAADGWVARRLNLNSEFGEYFDKEVDAFFLLTLCLLLYVDQRLGMWVLIPGLLRYLFVAYLRITRPSPIKEQRTRSGRWIYFLVMLSMISAFTTWDTVYVPFVVSMSIVLCLSFADSIRRFHWQPSMPRLRTRQIQTDADLQQFFDAAAVHYSEQHGHPQKLLCYRLSLIRTLIGQRTRGTILEIGCGIGNHLFQLAGQFSQVMGTDLSPAMIEKARETLVGYDKVEKFSLVVDRAEELSTVSDEAIDVVLCVGAFEHMTDQPAVLTQISRVLKAGGCLVCLTPNGDYVWYRRLAPVLGYDTRHLSSDRLMTLSLIDELLSHTRLTLADSGYWTFIPRGDIGTVLSVILTIVDLAGRYLSIPGFRGGLYFKAVKPKLQSPPE